MNLYPIRSILIISFIFISIAGKSQQVYFNIDGNQISEKKYTKTWRNEDFYPFEEQVDDSTYHTLLIRRKAGQLDHSVNEKIWTILERNNPNLVTDVDFVTISYLHGITKCGGTWAKGRYLKRQSIVQTELQKIGAVAMLKYHFGDAELKRYQRVENYIHDEDGFIANQFLEAHVSCSSYIVLNKDGYYKSYLGEMAIEDLVEMTFTLYSHEGEITKIDGRPVTIIEIQYSDEVGNSLTEKEYNRRKKKGVFSEYIDIKENIKTFSLQKED